MAHVVGEDQLRAVRAVAVLVPENGQVRPVLSEATTVVANWNSQGDTQEDAVQGAVRYDDNAALVLGACRPDRGGRGRGSDSQLDAWA